MSRFNLVHVGGAGLRGTEAYREVIETIQWGLRQLGHAARYTRNEWRPAARNIIFGGHLAPDLLAGCPADTIYCNLEQISGHPQYDPRDPKDTVAMIASRFQIWEYTAANLETWNRLALKHPVKLVPVGYAPILSRIENAARQDIDVLLYGAVGPNRLSVFHSLGALINGGVSAVFASGLYGESRDGLIARSRIVLNVNNIPNARVFEIVRISYLMANAKAVVSDIYPDSFVEADIAEGIIFVPTAMIARACWDLLADEDRRTRLERQALACISRRDIRVFLAAALA